MHRHRGSILLVGFHDRRGRVPNQTIGGYLSGPTQLRSRDPLTQPVPTTYGLATKRSEGALMTKRWRTRGRARNRARAAGGTAGRPAVRAGG
ncbi:hypothetical protein FRAAL2516 [Frankia alni ACN14a]|uniref:Uncharacterized protein n=1 Tax=Frankia alni (strain DSM 45986 / CECT 9034 / ACN14a) TaxID=326424 RepID=Q0RMT4_FRAAA|nr:hypothetical protein FRAAL2516 [Frankia alni ACN14a]